MKLKLRDWMWLTLVFGLAMGWWLSHRALSHEHQRVSERLAKVDLALMNAGIHYRKIDGEFQVVATEAALAEYKRIANRASWKLFLIESRLEKDGYVVQWGVDNGLPTVEIKTKATVANWKDPEQKAGQESKP